MTFKKTIYSKLEIEGLHCWPDCNIEEVSYLRNPHRHLFVINAFCNVYHNDRDIEFIELKHKITRYLNNKYFNSDKQCCDFGSMSCESIAVELIRNFGLIKCSVSEDGENGCEVVVE